MTIRGTFHVRHPSAFWSIDRLLVTLANVFGTVGVTMVFNVPRSDFGGGEFGKRRCLSRVD
jgi:uncharacterized membrane protein